MSSYTGFGLLISAVGGLVAVIGHEADVDGVVWTGFGVLIAGSVFALASTIRGK